MVFKNQCLIIKVGSTLLVDERSGQLNTAWLASLIADVKQLQANHCQVVIVSSGSVALGCQILGFHRQRLSLEKKQAAAAVGQIQLSHNYQRLLNEQGMTAAQILLSLDDSEDRKRFLNARNTLSTLLKMGLVPVVNENDTVATSEIQYGDNDRLAARVAQMIHADTLVLLSDIDGFYEADPNLHPNAQLIPEVLDLNAEISSMAQDSHSNLGSGGMKTKIAAAKIVLSCGGNVLITAGKHLHPLSHYSLHQKGTWFRSRQSKLSAKKAWLREHLKPHGSIAVDKGAESAIQHSKSLLPIGIIHTHGRFKKGDVVSIVNQEGKELARGLSNYACDEIQTIMGCASNEIVLRLGYDGIHEVIHYNNMVRVEHNEYP